MASSYAEDWGVGLGLHGDWGGPILDHFMTMLATLLLPIRFVCMCVRMLGLYVCECL